MELTGKAIIFDSEEKAKMWYNAIREVGKTSKVESLSAEMKEKQIKEIDSRAEEEIAKLEKNYRDRGMLVDIPLNFLELQNRVFFDKFKHDILENANRQKQMIMDS